MGGMVSNLSVEEVITGLLSCNQTLISAFKKRLYKHNGPCLKANPRELKSIRAKKHHLEPWIRNTDMKVVHLVRDPRARYFSARRANFKYSRVDDHNENCATSMDIEAMGQSLGARFTSLRYEDLTDEKEYVKSLFAKVGISFTNKTARFLGSRSRKHHKK